MVQLLLEYGVAINATTTSLGATSLQYAVEPGHTAVVQLLLERGADVNTPDKSNVTPLQYATRKGHTAIVQLLLAHGATPPLPRP